MLGTRDRILLVGGVVGPAAFVIDWAVLGARRSPYSPINDAISRLAELHAPTRPAMTAGFVVYGAGLLAYGSAIRHHVEGRSWIFATATGVTTMGVAAFPLGSPTSGTIHAVFAAVGYGTLAAVPITASAALRASGHQAAAAGSMATGIVAALLLAASALGAPSHGLTQRIGLTLGDTWVAASALWVLRHPLGCRPAR